MIDYLALALSHSLLFIAGWQLMSRVDLDQDPPADAPEPPAATETKPGLRIRA
ncbi:MAG: hypothetical protein ACKOW1_05835 [Novosphingobium sp.]